jgi:glycosyltransferase involved in cell wall biosynthesis
VLAEAYAAGLPILSTPVGIAEDVADLIVSQEIAQYKPGKFAEFIEGILWNSSGSQRQTETDPMRFSSESIGKRLKEIYTLCTASE